MTPGHGERQLELFDVTHQSTFKPRPELRSRWLLSLRYDQLVLVSMGALISVTIVFACGVERGKQLTRAERVLLAREQPAASRPQTTSTVESSERSQDTPAASPTKAEPKSPAAPAQTPKAIKKPSRLAGRSKAQDGRSRYAIQVVAYTRPQLAKQELERLHARGKPAFLVMREGRTIVYVGPFPSKGHASETLSGLKTTYQDCFIKTL